MSFEEQIISKGQISEHIFAPNEGYSLYYPSVLKIGEYPRNIRPRDAFRPIARERKYFMDYN